MVQVLPVGESSVRFAKGWLRCAEANHKDEQRKERSGVLFVNVGDIVVMRSTFTNEDILVNYRGSMGGGKAMVIPHPKGLQMAVPVEWLREQVEQPKTTPCLNKESK
jgi:hypothetical protein